MDTRSTAAVDEVAIYDPRANQAELSAENLLNLKIIVKETQRKLCSIRLC
jgi:hypothetical protein